MKTSRTPDRTVVATDAVSGGFDPFTRACGVIMLIGAADLVVTCLLAQFLRTDLDWVTTATSVYVYGPYGAWVRASFFAPAPGIILLGVGWYRSLDARARSVVPLILFVVAAVALCMLGMFRTDTTANPVDLHGRIHQWATFGSFVCLTTGMLLQSWRVRYDARWSFRFIPAFTVAAAAVVYFWIYALVKPIPRGIGEKALIALVLVWLWRAGWWLARGRTN